MCERLGFGKCNPTPSCLTAGAVEAHRTGLRGSWSWNASLPFYRPASCASTGGTPLVSVSWSALGLALGWTLPARGVRHRECGRDGGPLTEERWRGFLPHASESPEALVLKNACSWAPPHTYKIRPSEHGAQEPAF